jgi:hypothetical protein
MQGTFLKTHSENLRRAVFTNSTASAFTAPVVRGAVPDADVHENGTDATGRAGAAAQNSIKLIPFGTGDDNTTFDMRVIGWWRHGHRESKQLWIPEILAELTATLSTSVGLAGRAVAETERFADTIAVAAAYGAPFVAVKSPANNTPGSVMIDLLGCQLFSFDFDLTGATAANALFTLL